MEKEEKSMPESKEKSQKDVKVVKGDGKSSSQNMVLIIGVILIILLLSIGAIWVFSKGSTDQEDVEVSGPISQQMYDDLNARLEVCRTELSVNESCEDEGLAKMVIDLGTNSTPFMYRVDFDYPVNLYKGSHVLAEDSFTLRMNRDFLSDLTREEVSRTVFEVGSSDSVRDQPVEDGSIEIMGKAYPITKSIHGEGFYGYSYKDTYYTVKLEEDLYLTVTEQDGQETTYCVSESDNQQAVASGGGLCEEGRSDCVILPDCTTYEPEVLHEMKTTPEELESYFDIMRSFTYEKL